MKLRKSRKKIKLMIPVIGMLCSLGSFTVGFSMWTTTGGASGGLIGTFESDDTAYVDNPITVFTVPSTGRPAFTALAGNGFLIDNEYVNSITLTWKFRFYAKTALPLIESLAAKKVWFNFNLTISNIPERIADFTTEGMTLTPSDANAGTVTNYQQTVDDQLVYFVNTGTAINQQWTITGVSTTKTYVTYVLTVPLTYTGTKADFPNLRSNILTLSFEAGEYKDA